MTTNDYLYLQQAVGLDKNRPEYMWGYTFEWKKYHFAAAANGFVMNIVRDPDFNPDIANIVRFKTSYQPHLPEKVIPLMTSIMDNMELGEDRVEIYVEGWRIRRMYKAFSTYEKVEHIKLVFGEDWSVFANYDGIWEGLGRYQVFGDRYRIDLKNRVFNPEFFVAGTTEDGDWRIILNKQLDKPALLKCDRYSSLIMPMQA